jgi:RNA polymerase sigma-70 factor, ECF subfamily
MNLMTDTISSTLITRAQRGSPEAISDLYAAFHQSIYRYLYYRTSDFQTAEDLTSEVFLKMVQFLPLYRRDNSVFQAWLFQIARNLAIDHYRRSSTHPVLPLEENLDSDSLDLDQTVDFNFNCEELAQALGKLNDVQRDVLLLRFIEGIPIAETARILHKSEDAIKALQRRGLAVLRVLFTQQEVTHG